MISLPEQRVLMGKVGGLGEEPQTLRPDDMTQAVDRAQALLVMQGADAFSSQQRDRILARLYLGE